MHFDSEPAWSSIDSIEGQRGAAGSGACRRGRGRPALVAGLATRWSLGHPTSNNIKISQKGTQLASATPHFTWSIHLAQVACRQVAGEGQQKYKYLPPPRLQLTSFLPFFTNPLDITICRVVHPSSFDTTNSIVLSLTSVPLTQPPFVAEPHCTSPQGKPILFSWHRLRRRHFIHQSTHHPCIRQGSQ